MKWNPLNTKIGLALGGGAAKGIAHIGVLQAFEEEQLTISYISGTSVGALVASYYAFGKPIDEILSIGETLNLKSIVNFTFAKRGLFTTDAIKDMVHRDLGDVNIEQANIPLAICTADIETGEQVVFRQGNLADAICASMAVPGLFVPVQMGKRLLVDGGIIENVPISPLEKMGAGIIIAIDLNGVKKYVHPNNTLDVVSNAINIGMDLKTREQLKKADLKVSLDLSHYNRTNNADRVQELVFEGYLPMKRKMKRLVWHRRINTLHYLAKAFIELVPFKVPEVLQRQFKKLQTRQTQFKKP